MQYLVLLIFLGFALATGTTPAAAAAQCGTQRGSDPQDGLALAIYAMHQRSVPSAQVTELVSKAVG